MKIIVTCGPSFEPIDEVRRLTNFSTGELGVHLAHTLAQAGHEVVCLKGTGATAADPLPPSHVQHFNTNDDLLEQLTQASLAGSIGAVFHTAALCDYKISRVEDESGHACASAKIPSRSGSLTLTLAPATKVIHHMRRLFPNSILVGWKYELAGSRQDAINRAFRQIEENRTDACVLNGRAYGPGFGFCQPSRNIIELATKPQLSQFLAAWVGAPARTPPAPVTHSPLDPPRRPQVSGTASPD